MDKPTLFFWINLIFAVVPFLIGVGVFLQKIKNITGDIDGMKKYVYDRRNGEIWVTKMECEAEKGSNAIEHQKMMAKLDKIEADLRSLFVNVEKIATQIEERLPR